MTTADRRGGEVPAPWRAAFAAGRLSAVQRVLLGMNAHINYDLPLALLAVVGDAEFGDQRLLELRAADHRAAEGRTVALFGVRFRYKVTSQDSAGRLAVLEVEIPPKTLVKPHTHTREDEYSLILDGTVGVRVGDDEREVTAGSYLVKPRGIPHAMWNAGAAPARIVEILSPGGLETYFEELAPILERHAPPPEYYGLAERYGLTIEDSWIEELERKYGVRM